jgi:hypothetical protein
MISRIYVSISCPPSTTVSVPDTHDQSWYRTLTAFVALLVVTSVAAAPVAGAAAAEPREDSVAGSGGGVGPVAAGVESGVAGLAEGDGDTGSHDAAPVTAAAVESEPNDRGETADRVSVGETVEATLSNGSDVDYFKFEADAGQELAITVSVPNASQGLGIQVFEEGASLETLRSGINPGQQPRTFTTGATLQENTTYFVIVDSGLNWDGPAEYNFSVEVTDLAPEEPNEVAANATPYTLGENRSARRTLGDIDVYSFQAQRGEQLNASFTVTPNTTGGRIEIFEQGESIERARLAINPGEDRRTVRDGDMLETTTTYYAYVDPGLNYAGRFNYSFEITAEERSFLEPNEVPDDATRLTPNPAAGSRGGYDDRDLYVFRAESGETVSVNFTGPRVPAGEVTTLFVNREGPDGGFGTELLRLDSGGGPQSGSFTAQATGTYLVNIPTRPGTYEFDVTVDGTRLGVPNDRFELNENRTQADANASVSLGTYEGLQVVNDDTDVYAVDLTDGETFTAATTFDDADGDPSLAVLDASGTVVANSSTTATGRRVTYAVPADGTYYVRVAGSGPTAGTVPYDLTLRVPTQVTVAPSPQSVTAGPNETASVDVAVAGATGGVSGYAFTLGINESVAAIESVDPAGAADPSAVTVAPDGASATVNASAVGIAASGGTTPLATVTLATQTVGDGNLSVSDVRVTDAGGFDYVTTATDGEVRVATGPGTIGPSENGATDPDDDGQFEDVDGDGQFDFLDVITLVFVVDSLSPATGQYFDFDGNGQFTFTDVIELVFQL